MLERRHMGADLDNVCMVLTFWQMANEIVAWLHVLPRQDRRLAAVDAMVVASCYGG
jgi:hypothetical protein